MTDNQDPKKTQGDQWDQSQGWAFGGVSFDEIQEKKDDSALWFSLDMDDLPDLDDISLDTVAVEEPMVDAAVDLADDVSWLDATGDIALDDINLDDISLDDIQLDDLEKLDTTPTLSKDSPTAEVKVEEPQANVVEEAKNTEEPVKEISLDDLYKKPVEEMPSADINVDLGDEKVESVDQPTIDIDESVGSEPIINDATVESPETVSLDDLYDKEEVEEQNIDENSVTQDSLNTTDVSGVGKETDSVEETIVPVVAAFKAVEEMLPPEWVSKVVKKFYAIYNLINQWKQFVQDKWSIAVLATRTDKEEVNYAFSQWSNLEIRVERSSVDTSTKEKEEDTMVMSYRADDKEFVLNLADIDVYTEKAWDSSDKDLQYTVVDKLGKFSLLLSEFVSKKTKELEEKQREEEERRKKKDITRKLRDF